MITKLISTKTVIAKIIADLDLKENDTKITDIREWIGEAVEKIGAVPQFIKKVSGVGNTPYLKIKGHQAALPCDLHHLHQVAYSNNGLEPWFPMRKATGSFDLWGKSCDGCCCEDCPNKIIPDDVLVNLVIDMYGDIDKTKALELLNTNQNLKTILSNLINTHTTDYSNASLKSSFGFQYTIKPGFIVCNVPCGYLKLSYSAIPVDEEGYPLVPDLVSYTEAIYWYVTMKLKYPEYLNGRMNREIYYDIRRSWNFYRNQAYSEALMPNEDGLESIKNTWNKIVPELHDHNTFYTHTGEKQIVYNINNR